MSIAAELWNVCTIAEPVRSYWPLKCVAYLYNHASSLEPDDGTTASAKRYWRIECLNVLVAQHATRYSFKHV